MKRLFIIMVMVLAGIITNAQTVKTDANGNYVATKKVTDTIAAKPTGKTYTDAKGKVYPVYVSVNGKLYVIRTSRTGNTYKQYLKVE